ncbi:Ring finger domain [Carpediemonas membranifera]|uniref:Ring finger domain n=1 Tax=Carpediemonas membranifera TaxID=201153 RepID=A0A8J6AS09_9EUKA|nr:Ring finger domain [Carpediemonas membranifera]|eukprot:KAG9392926.1 Ring finger domain [Carpediemonas membranifera]
MYQCPVCMNDERSRSSPLVSTACGHVFCHACIVEWLRAQGTCPCCREPVQMDDLSPIFLQQQQNAAERLSFTTPDHAADLDILVAKLEGGQPLTEADLPALTGLRDSLASIEMTGVAQAHEDRDKAIRQSVSVQNDMRSLMSSLSDESKNRLALLKDHVGLQQSFLDAEKRVFGLEQQLLSEKRDILLLMKENLTLRELAKQAKAEKGELEEQLRGMTGRLEAAKKEQIGIVTRKLSELNMVEERMNALINRLGSRDGSS